MTVNRSNDPAASEPGEDQQLLTAATVRSHVALVLDTDPR